MQPSFARPPIARLATAVLASALTLVLASGSPRSAFADTSAPLEQSVSNAVELLTLNPCLVRPALVEEIEEWLERTSVDGRVRVKVGEENGTLRFSIELAGGERSIHEFPDLPPDCAGQRRAVALSIALAIDALSPGPAHDRAAKWAFSAYGALTTVFPERVGEGGGAFARRALRPWFWPSVGVFAAVAPNQVLRADLPVRFDTWLAAASIEGCVLVLSIPNVDLTACAGPWIGTLITVARGIPSAGSDGELWGAFAAALELHTRLTRSFGFHIGADALMTFRRSKVQVNTPEGLIVVEQGLPRMIGMFRFGPVIFF